MNPTYKIVSEFTSEKDPEYISVSPYWCIALVRFAQPLTYSRTKTFDDKTDSSFDANNSTLIRERNLLVLTDDVQSMSISHSKGSYVSSLQATLLNSNLNFLSEIQPNDWVFAWIVNDDTQGRQLVERIFDPNEACNKFEDGLKFVGRVQSIRKLLQQDPAGRRTVRYQLQAAGFKELDASVFYDPALARAEESLGQHLTEMNVDMSDVFKDASQSSGGLSTTKLIPTLLKLFVGEGIPPTSAAAGEVQIATGATSTPEAPYAYAIPATAARLLGQTNQSKAVPSYADILDLVIGVQKYSPKDSTPEAVFSPQGSDSSSNHRVLNDSLLGTYLPVPIQMSGKSVWSMMEEFRNPAVNEMYTSLRINPEGRVVPTLTVRQLPFSTATAGDKATDFPVTQFLNVPRWFCDPILVHSLDIGKTDALHMNFIHVYGQASADGGVPLTIQLLQNPPIRDEQDIKRSGLRPHMQTVNCSLDDTLNEPKKWMKILADFMIGQQYTLNGTISMIGIAAPICPGDNFEFDDTVYHIEAVSHTCSIIDGLRQFGTSVSLSHGVRTDTPSNGATQQQSKDSTKEFSTAQDLIGIDEELSVYSGTKPEDNLGYDPGLVLEISKQFKTKQVGDFESNNDTEGLA